MHFPAESHGENLEEDTASAPSDSDATRAVEIAFTPPQHVAPEHFDDGAAEITPAAEVLVEPPALSKVAVDAAVRQQDAGGESPAPEPESSQIEATAGEEDTPEETPSPAPTTKEAPKDPQKQTPASASDATDTPRQLPTPTVRPQLVPVEPSVETTTTVQPDTSADSAESEATPTPEPEPTPAPEQPPEAPDDIEDTSPAETPRVVAPSARSDEVIERIDTSIAAEEVGEENLPSALEKEIHSSADYKPVFLGDNVPEVLEEVETCDIVALEIPGIESDRLRYGISEACSAPVLTRYARVWLAQESQQRVTLVKELQNAGADIMFIGLTQDNPGYEYMQQARHFDYMLASAHASNESEAVLRPLLANDIYTSVMARQKEADCIAAQLEALHRQWPEQLIGVVLSPLHARGTLLTDSVVPAPPDASYHNEATNIEDALAPIDPELFDRVLLENMFKTILPIITASTATEAVRRMSADEVREALDVVEAIKEGGNPYAIVYTFLKSFVAAP